MKKGYLLFIAVFCVAIIKINAQNNPPVAINDSSIIILEFVPGGNNTFEFNVLINDYDPDGDPIEIAEVYQQGSADTIIFTDSTIIYDFGFSSNSIIEHVFVYRVYEVEDTTSMSNWAYLYVNPQMSINAPVARNDTITCSPGYSSTVNVLLNDYDPNGDSFYLYRNSNIIYDSTIEIIINFNDYYTLHKGYGRLPYLITEDTNNIYNSFDYGLLYYKIENISFYDSLNINNVNARFNCFGNHFWDMPGGTGAKYFVPNGSTKASIFSNSFWIGGLDENDNLHLAGERYRQVGEDYWHGPVSDVYDSIYDAKWFKIWKLTKQEIEYHKAHWWESGYAPIEDILSWPGNGDESAGQLAQLAPYYDNNNDGIYESMDGDYPLIKGDQALFFIFNDARDFHSETNGVPLGIEIHAMAYAFDTPEDSALWSTTFLHYDIINLSDTTYHDTYIGSYTDTDLGYAWDDYIGCDVQRGFYYTYNGIPVDGNGEPEAYGEHPPAQGIMFLGGPFMNADGIDNPKYDVNGNQICDESINGLNFGDTIVDNERLGMTGFFYFNNSGGPQGDPQIAAEYYNYLRGYWKDNIKCLYGSNGHINSGALGPECNFMFPGDSDTCNWGTNGILPNGGFNQNGYYWTEEITGNNPYDRRGVGTSGPFTFEPGDVQQIDLAFVWARDYNGTPWSSVELLKEYCSYIKDKFENDYNFFSGVNYCLKNENNIRLFPNPVYDKLTVKLSHKTTNGTFAIFNVRGENVISGKLAGENELRLNINNLQKG
ncbi:MAG: hypothetical protein K8R37_11795, partial [Bacteroidales bacterium]|nr:hypothetical protein [Bacteroidales bacterium]